MSMSYEDRRKLLESRLKPSRYRHSLGVADTAAFLAERFSIDVEQARLAGLLHDCAREFPNDAMVAEADKRRIAYGPIERAMPLLLHAYLGACASATTSMTTPSARPSTAIRSAAAA